MDSSPINSPGNESDRSEYARRLGGRVGVNFGPVFESVSYLMGRYCKSSFSLARCLEALNSDENMRKKIAREIWCHYTHGILVYDNLGVDFDEYHENGKAYTPDEEGTKVATEDKGTFAGNDSDTVSDDEDDVETAAAHTDDEAVVGLTDDERLIAAAAASFGYDGDDADVLDGEGIRNDDDDEDVDSAHSVDDACDNVDYNDDDDSTVHSADTDDDVNNEDADNADDDDTAQSVDTDSDDVDDDDVDNTDDDATVQVVDTDSDAVDDDDVDNADDDATVQVVDTDGDNDNADDVDNTDDDATVQFADTDGDDVNNSEVDEDDAVRSDDNSTEPSDYDDVIVGSSTGGGIINRRDRTGSSSTSDETVYIGDFDEIRSNSSGDDSDNICYEDNDSVSNGNFERLVSPNSYEEDGYVNNDSDDAFTPSNEVVPPSSYGGYGSDGLPLNNGEVNTSDSDELVTTSDEDDDDDISYITNDPVGNFLGTLQEQCMWLYRRGLGEGDVKFKSDPIKRRARLKKLADFYFAEKMDGNYPRIKYQKPTYQNGYEFGLTDYLQRLGKRLGVEFGPVFEGCAIKMGRYLRSTRTLQRCVDIINNDEEMRKGLASSVWHHFIEGIIQRIR